MPIKIPSATERNTDTAIRPKVSMAGSHMSVKPQNMVAATQNKASRKPALASARSEKASTTTGQGTRIRKVSTWSRAHFTPAAMPRVNQLILVFSHFSPILTFPAKSTCSVIWGGNSCGSSWPIKNVIEARRTTTASTVTMMSFFGRRVSPRVRTCACILLMPPDREESGQDYWLLWRSYKQGRLSRAGQALSWSTPHTWWRQSARPTVPRC